MVFVSLQVNFILANTADPDEMPHYAAFHRGLQCLPKYPFRGGLTELKNVCLTLVQALLQPLV